MGGAHDPLAPAAGARAPRRPRGAAGAAHASYRLALASSSRPSVIAATLDAIGARQLFELFVSGAEVPRGKPSPEVFLETARRLGVSPVGCLVIEDSHHGVTAARAAGMRCLAIPCPTTAHQDFTHATARLNALPDVLTYLDLASQTA